jgi:hypothetical protein
MADLTAQRTLVKSPPELWSELSEVESLAKHLGELGEIRITKVEPETTVAWEGEQISGTVQLEQSGWGTRVTFRATVPEPDPLPEPEATPVPPSEPSQVMAEPAPVVESPQESASEPVLESAPLEPRRERGSFITRWLFRERRAARAPAAVVEPRTPVAEPEREPEPPTVDLEAVAVDPQPAPAAPESAEVQRVRQVLDGTLEALGQAHHRPFSRG